jgi:signal transduction histidine kinase/pSer/pThr/pTyr-binding forkhead associated (FHA) protein
MSKRAESVDGFRPETNPFDKKEIEEKLKLEARIAYRPIPYSHVTGDTGSRFVWRVRLDLLTDSSKCLGLDVNGEAVLGRGQDGENLVDLTPYEAEKFGVSRHHAMLRPTITNLFVIDLDSTNGTWLNGRPIGVNTPYSLGNGDILTLGSLDFVARIVPRPKGQTAALREKATLADVLAQLAKAITSQLDLDEVLNQVVEMAMSLTHAGETAVWLVDEQLGELSLEAELGIEDTATSRTRLPVSDTLAGEVIRTGKPRRASRGPESEQVKVETDYLVEALVYVPLTLGGVTFGVLAAAHREAGKTFSKRDEKLLAAIADFAAIAVHNSRRYQATDSALVERVEELAALGELSRAVSASLELDKIHDVLMEHVHKHWQVETASLWLVNEHEETMSIFPSLSSESSDAMPGSFELGQGVVGRAAQSGEPLLISHADEEAGYATAEDTGKIKSELAVPIKLDGRVIGILDLETNIPAGFSEADILMLSAVADRVGIAIENAHLYEELQIAYQELQETARLKGEMIQNVSHEFRTPLNYIMGYVGLVLDETPMGMGPLTDEQRDGLQIVFKQTEKLARLVGHFVTFDRMGSIASNRKPADVAPLLEDAVESARLMAAETQITLALEIAKSMPLVTIDSMSVSQVLDNLLANALKFTPRDGQVTVMAWLDPSDKQVHVSVSDTGPGIPDDARERLFERFYQVDGTATRRFGGVGLGLAVCKEIVEVHGGKIWVEGVSDEGTTFIFTLPPAP